MAPALTSKTETDFERKLRKCVLALIVIAAFRFWCMPLKSSLWLDEAGTYWTIKDGLHTAMVRVFDAQTTSSPMHVALEWAFLKLPGPIEVRLRVLSVIAVLLSAVLLYRLGTRLLDREAALVSVCMFMSIGGVIFAGSDARPYALWLLATVACMLTLVDWMDTGRFRSAVAFVLLASLSVYAHFLAFLMFMVYAAYALMRTGNRSPVRPRALVWAALAIAAAVSPLVPVLLRFHAERNLFYYMAKTPTMLDLEVALAPPNIILGLFGGLLVSRLIYSRVQFSSFSTAGSSWILLIACSTIPALVLFAISFSSDAKLFYPRHMVCAAPGTALLAGLAIRCIQPAGARSVITASVLLLALITFGPIRHLDVRHQGGEDWREASQTVASYANATTPVLVESGFPESNWMDWAAAGTSRSQFFAPLAVYPMTGAIVPLPMTADGVSRDYLKSVISQKLAVSRRFLLVTYQITDKLWLDGRLDGSFKSKPVGSSKMPLVFLYERD
jgi:4-amino-4-deoxy-L-arabinose transferase-like glycosyltransferase